MSLVLLAHACSHLQNASRAYLGLTSLPRTNQLHHLLLQLQKHGYVNTVVVAGPTPPPPSALAPVMSLHGREEDVGTSAHVISAFDPRISVQPGGRDVSLLDIQAAQQEEEQEQRTSTTRGSIQELDDEDPSAVTQSNVSSRRLWVGMKYYNQRPVLERMGVVSKPTRRIWMSCPDLEALMHGRKTGYVHGLRGIGEGMFVSTDRGIMEIRECVERRVGGMLLCRVNGI